METRPLYRWKWENTWSPSILTYYNPYRWSEFMIGDNLIDDIIPYFTDLNKHYSLLIERRIDNHSDLLIYSNIGFILQQMLTNNFQNYYRFIIKNIQDTNKMADFIFTLEKEDYSDWMTKKDMFEYIRIKKKYNDPIIFQIQTRGKKEPLEYFLAKDLRDLKNNFKTKKSYPY